MFYKELNGQWMCAHSVECPDGTVLNAENKLNYDGWEWHDTPPQAYLDFLGL